MRPGLASQGQTLVMVAHHIKRKCLLHDMFLFFSHRLEYFKDFDLQSIMGDGWVQPESDAWKGKP